MQVEQPAEAKGLQREACTLITEPSDSPIFASNVSAFKGNLLLTSQAAPSTEQANLRYQPVVRNHCQVLPALQQYMPSPEKTGLQAERPLHCDSEASKRYHEHACVSMQVWLVWACPSYCCLVNATLHT